MRARSLLVVAAFAVAATGLAAGPAVARSSVEQLLINGAPTTNGVSSLDPSLSVDVNLVYPDQLELDNLSTKAGAHITEMDGGVGPGGEFSMFRDKYDSSVACGPGSASRPPPEPFFSCGLANPPNQGIGDGRSSFFTYSFTPPAYVDYFNWVDVWFDYANVGKTCRPPGFASDFRSGPVAVAADNCTPPSGSRIASAQVNQSAHTALFRFAARGTKTFVCELIRNGTLMFRHSCNSPKPYANRLDAGKYTFLVWGVDHGGSDPIPAFKHFKLS